MKNKTLTKYAFREIGSSKARFFSILIIVMLGVSIFVGVTAAGPIMTHTVDQYFDEYKRPDLIIRSSIGLNDDEVEDTQAEVADDGYVEALYFEDAILTENNQLTRIYSLTDHNNEEINQYVIKEGRLPQAEAEIALDAYDLSRQGLEIGDTVSFNKGEGDDLDFLADQDYTIVGFVESPLYIENGSRGYTDIGDGNLDAFALVKEENFESDYYQQALVRYKDTEQKDIFSKEYLETMEECRENLESSLTPVLESRASDLQLDLQDDLDQAQADINQAQEDFRKQEEDLNDYKEALDSQGLLDGDLNALPPSVRNQVQTYYELEEDLSQYKNDFEKELQQVESDMAEADQAIQALESPSIMVLDASDDSAYDGFKKNADRISAIAKIFPVFFFLVAILVTLTTMTRMVDEGRQEIGVLKSFGYSNKQVMFKYLLYALLAGFLGWLLGLFGYLIFPTIIYNAYASLYSLPEIQLRAYASLSILSLLAALIATIGASLSALRPSLRSRSAELMQDKVPKAGKRIFLERIRPLWEALSFNYKITFRNLFRYKKRMYMTILGIAGCMALMLMGFGVSDSVNDIKDRQFGLLDQYDARVFLNSDATDQEIKEYDTHLSESDKIDDYLSLANEEAEVQATDGTRQTLSLVIPKDQQAILDYKSFISIDSGEEVELPDQGVLMTQKISELLDLTAGDRVKIESEDGKESYDFYIADVVEHYSGHALYMSAEEYERVTGKQVQTNETWLKYDQSLDEEVSDEVSEKDAVNGMAFMSDVAEVFSDSLSSLDLVVAVLTIAAALLAFVVLYNLTNVNIAERQKELATIKVLGFYDREVSMYIFRENIFLTILGILLGIVFGIFLHRYIVLIVEFDDLMFGRFIHLSSYLYASLLTFAFSILVMVFMHFTLKKTNMMDALKEE